MFHDGNYAEVSFGLTGRGSRAPTRKASPAATSTARRRPRRRGRAPARRRLVGGADRRPALRRRRRLRPGLRRRRLPLRRHPCRARVARRDRAPAQPLDTRWSLHGGLRAERFGGEATLDGSGYGPFSGYAWTGDADWGLGYVVGGAFEIPEIALRVALTYGSEIDHDLDATENFFGPTTTEVTMPQSVNLDFQTGIAPGTLVYGLVRWVNWAGWSVEPAGLFAATGLPLIEFDSDAFTYRLGLARQFTEAFAAAVEITHETAKNQTTTPLDPYDGFTTLGVGGRWSHPSGLEIGAGVGYSWLGDATASLPTGASAHFADNHAVAARLRIGLSLLRGARGGARRLGLRPGPALSAAQARERDDGRPQSRLRRRDLLHRGDHRGRAQRPDVHPRRPRGPRERGRPRHPGADGDARRRSTSWPRTAAA